MKKIALLLPLLAMVACGGPQTHYSVVEQIDVVASQFTPGAVMTAPRDTSTLLSFHLVDRGEVPFVQSSVLQTPPPSDAGADMSRPYFDMQAALPIPPVYTEHAPRDLDKHRFEMGEMAGIAPGVFFHNHSAGMDVLPNGDLLAVYFSSKVGVAEKDTSTTFVQSRLRYGSLEWDMPEPFFITKGYNDQSALVWNDGGTVRFFGGGRYISDWVPFRMAVSEDNGASWTFSIPVLDTAATDYEAQPVSSAFRGPDGAMYFVSDAADSHSFLWRSRDGGRSWHDMGGRTGARHSTIVPLDDKGHLLSLGGKNANVNGWMPQNESFDWGETWTESVASPFPPVGGGQRPCLIRLKSGRLLTVGDSFVTRGRDPGPEWKHGLDCYVAISDDNGASWHIKSIPYGLPQHGGRMVNTLGYVNVRQAADGMIHLLTTYNFPNIHYEFNEAWILSDEPTEWSPLASSTVSGGQVREYKEYYTGRGGKPTKALKAQWKARICPDGRYLLDGPSEYYYPDGSLQHSVVYACGRKTGEELFYNPDGSLRWKWERDLAANTGVWTQYWPNGNKKVVSHWVLCKPTRDGGFSLLSYTAHGPATHYAEDGKTVVKEYEFIDGLTPESSLEQ